MIPKVRISLGFENSSTKFNSLHTPNDNIHIMNTVTHPNLVNLSSFLMFSSFNKQEQWMKKKGV